jgi:hypothetical protein
LRILSLPKRNLNDSQRRKCSTHINIGIAEVGYLDAISRFHNYSFGNVLEIARQRPAAMRAVLSDMGRFAGIPVGTTLL